MNRNFIVILFVYVLSISTLIGQPDVTMSQNNDHKNSYWLNTVPYYSLSNIKLGKYYSSTLEIKIPRDTIRSTNGRITRVHVSRIEVIGVNGLPEGLSYSPKITDSDNHNYFSFNLEIYGRARAIPDKSITAKLSVTFSRNNGNSIVRTYKIGNIILKEDRSTKFETSIDEGIGLKSLKSYPNPINDITEVSFWSSKLQLVEFEVRDAIGNLKFKKTFTAKMGSNKISFSQKDLPNGLYLYSIKNEDITLAKRLIVK